MREEELLKKIDPKKLPRHIAIIMDGNGRWARMRKLNRIEGHRRATETVRNVVMTCRELNIEILTLYTFSQENWNRPKTEISALMILLKKFLRDELEEMMGNNMRLISIGRTERLPVDVKRTLDFVTGQTKNNDGMILNLALSWLVYAILVAKQIFKVHGSLKNKRSSQPSQDFFSLFLSTLISFA